MSRGYTLPAGVMRAVAYMSSDSLDFDELKKRTSELDSAVKATYQQAAGGAIFVGGEAKRRRQDMSDDDSSDMHPRQKPRALR